MTFLQELAVSSPAIAAKPRSGRNVIIDALARICNAFNCDIDNICEVVPNEKEIAQ